MSERFGTHLETCPHQAASPRRPEEAETDVIDADDADKVTTPQKR